MDALFENYPFIKRHFLPLALGSAGLIFFVYGLIAFIAPSAPQDTVIFHTAEQTSVSTDGLGSRSDNIEHILVDVSGAVNEPGVYELEAGSRVKDAILKSGGLVSDANTEIISKTINFAAKVIDGEKIYIPFTDEENGTGSVMDVQSTTININKASVTELDTLPGIGEVTAGKIIAGRPYQKIDDLLEKKIVSSKVFEQIREQISVY